jgi:kynurenine formamidase
MCVPQTFEAVRLDRRSFLRMAAGTAVGAALGGTSLLPAPARAQTRSLSYANIMDLTHVLHSRFPSFNPDFFPRLSRRPFVTIEKNGFYGNIVSYWEHTGTHMDAPAHFVTARWFVHEIPASRLIGPAVVIHIHEKATANPDAQVTPDDIRAYEDRYGRIPDGAVVFMHSGWEQWVNDEASYRRADSTGTMHFPGFHPEAAQMLVEERNILGIGVDTLSLDYGRSTDFKTHLTILGANKWGLENVANLARIPPRGATVFVGAPKLANGSGGPLRLIAVW